MNHMSAIIDHVYHFTPKYQVEKYKSVKYVLLIMFHFLLEADIMFSLPAVIQVVT